jgi:excinuclease ABC subunit A
LRSLQVILRGAGGGAGKGPEGGDGGGQILYQGPLEGLKKVKGSHTARYV